MRGELIYEEYTRTRDNISDKSSARTSFKSHLISSQSLKSRLKDDPSTRLLIVVHYVIKYKFTPPDNSRLPNVDQITRTSQIPLCKYIAIKSHLNTVYSL